MDKVVDVVGLHHNPPERAVVLCVDEKSQELLELDGAVAAVQLADDGAVGDVECGEQAGNAMTQVVVGRGARACPASSAARAVTGPRPAPVITIDKAVPAELDVHLVCDNYANHKTPEIQKWLARHPRFHVHATPTGSFRINQVERWFGLLTDKLIRRGVHTSVQALENDIRAWIQTWNENPRPFTWTKSADEICNSLADYLAKIAPPSPEKPQGYPSDLTDGQWALVEPLLPALGTGRKGSRREKHPRRRVVGAILYLA